MTISKIDHYKHKKNRRDWITTAVLLLIYKFIEECLIRTMNHINNIQTEYNKVND